MTAHLTRRHFLAAAASAAALPSLARAQPVPVPATPSARAPVSIEIEARPIPAFDTRDRAHTRFGSLQYRSGLVLTSRYKDFGGISGLRLDDKGEGFIAISDKGNWFTGKIAYSGDTMVGIVDVEAAPMLGADGRPITARGWYDTESIAVDGPTVYIGLERVHQILKFDFGRDGVRARGEPIPQPPGMRKLPSNGSLEALVMVRRDRFKTSPLAGMLLAISERGLDSAGNIAAWIIGGKVPASFSVRRTKNYDISDAALLPSGDLLLLERKFSLFGDTGVRIRRIPLASIVPEAVIDGPTIFDADLGYEIDNFEGLDVHVTPEGDTVLTLISDDNFSMLQRTLLMQFTLLE
ncbi:esterase-like activity of phytase family protein [Tardiphaga sp. 37S4]|uniref:esterase-like activity of phytase family protein n=1 Tax=Tardiphaga sp. 37S4 TaxID=1404741 RepID=UPI001E519CDC|nr:esterase-like activity of phytase family protein [Tardiphaga sp. 37S4]UFS75648.1 esterase-like activity of phytase family protein [Tardiphaga sp. 37S4]